MEYGLSLCNGYSYGQKLGSSQHQYRVKWKRNIIPGNIHADATKKKDGNFSALFRFL